jgi:hypothetical protein
MQTKTEMQELRQCGPAGSLMGSTVGCYRTFAGDGVS